MTKSNTEAEIIDFPKEANKRASSTERIWVKLSMATAMQVFHQS